MALYIALQYHTIRCVITNCYINLYIMMRELHLICICLVLQYIMPYYGAIFLKTVLTSL